jgi:hypothetical protein
MNAAFKQSMLWKKSYLWVTLVFFLGSVILHWLFGWYAFKEEQTAHGQPIEFNNYVIEMLRDTMENWQSEFLQLIWQVVGLAVFLCVGSPSSKEGDDRKEEKIDFIIRHLEPEHYKELMEGWDKKYPRK